MKPTVVMDQHGKVREWSEQATTLFGYSRDEAVETSLGELIVPPGLRPYHEMGFRRYVQTREANCVGYTVEIEAMEKGGEMIPISLKIVPREEEDLLFFDAFIDRLNPS